jgi:hypothetical protein
MKTPQLFLAAILGLGLGLGLSACDTKVSQCNKLIEVVNKHTTPLAQSIAKLNDFDNNPEVADEFIGVVEAAEADIKALDLKDEKVAGFAKDYEGLMVEAKKLGTGLKEAKEDAEKRSQVVENADKVVKMEDEIVEKVNTYCQAS